MKFSRFKTFTTSYYFPQNLARELGYMYGLYSPLGNKFATIYWMLFRKSKWVRHFTLIDEKELDFPYFLIKKVEAKDSIMSFNMGSPGVEQKISILGYTPSTKQPFFAKFAQKELAKKLSKNEIYILQSLRETKFVPFLIDFKIESNYVFLKTECVRGTRPKTMKLTMEIVSISIQLSDLHLTSQHLNSDGLVQALSHGDFCPWNFIESQGTLRLIDWEMAADRPLGYDLFTYIYQTAYLFKDVDERKNLQENLNYIEYYYNFFGIENFYPYLKSFSEIKSHDEYSKGNYILAHCYDSLLGFVLSNFASYL